MRKYKLNVNYVIADIVTRIKIGSLRKLRFIKIVKTKIAIRLMHILYKNGFLRTFRIKDEVILVYIKYMRGQRLGKIDIVTRPGKRCYWTLGKLTQQFNLHNFSGFYVISTQKGLFTSNYCLLKARLGGEVLLKVEI